MKKTNQITKQRKKKRSLISGSADQTWGTTKPSMIDNKLLGEKTGEIIHFNFFCGWGL